MPGTVVRLSVSVLTPDLFVSATDVAVMVAEEGSSAMTFGAVYIAVNAPVDVIDPGEADHVTPILCESLVTVAEKFAVWFGHSEPGSFGKSAGGVP